MKLKRILAMLIATAMVLSIVPMAFAATAGVDIDFDTTTGFAEWKVASNRATNNAVTGIYGNSTNSMNISSPTGKSFTGTTGVRAYEENVSVSKTATRLSFRIAAADTNSRKAVSFDTGAAAPGTAVFEMSTDGYMYVLGTQICAYETERWYQVDLLIKLTGDFEVYIDGGSVNSAKTTGTADASAVLTDVFGEADDDTELRNLYYYMLDKADTNVTSNMYVDDFKTVVSDTDSEATIADSEKLVYTYTGSATFANGMMSDLGDGATVEGILADFTVTKGTIGIYDSLNQLVVSGAVAPGMKLVLASASESVKIEYALDCLNLVFTVPDEGLSTRDLTKTISATFNGTGEVEFYVNDSLKATVATAPYEYTVEHTIGGAYEVYVVVVTNGARISSDKKTYTYVANSVPTVSAVDAVGNVSNFGRINKTETVKLNVTATDSDYAESGVSRVELYFDGALVASKDAEAANTQTLTLDSDYVVSNLAVNTHSYYAKAYDADGAVATSDVVTFSVIETSTVDIDKATFESGNESIMGEYHPNIDAQLSTIPEPGNESNTVKAYVGTQSTMYMKNATSSFAGTTVLYWEMDIKTSNPSSNDFLEVRTSNNGERTTQFKISRLEMTADQWYRIKYIVNSQTSKQEMWISSDGGANWALVANESCNPLGDGVGSVTMGGSFASTRVYLNRTAATGYEFYMDNIHIYRVDETPYVSGIKYLDGMGSQLFMTNGTVDADVKSIDIEYNGAISTYFFGETGNNAYENFVITDSKGNECKRFTANAADTKVTITFDVALDSQETYTVSVVDIFETLAGGTPASFTFTTSPALFDAVGAVVETDGSGAEMVVKNSTGSSVTATVIYAVYSGDKLIYFGKQDNVSFATGEVPFTVDPAAQVGTGSGDLTAKVFFWSDLTAARTVKMGTVE